MTWQVEWMQRFYRSRPGWIDGTTQFHALIRAHAPPHPKIAEIGAGPTNPTSAFLASLGEVHGIDASEEVYGNVHLASRSVLENGRFPNASGSFDLAVSNYVVEHVQDARLHLTEIHRVLKPGARYVFRTPNLLHYVALVSRFTPHSFHKLVANPLRMLRAEDHDPWPTAYAMNTPAAVRRHAESVGFCVERMDLVEKEPSYGMYAKPLFLTFMAYERAVNASERLALLRANMFVILRKDAKS